MHDTTYLEERGIPSVFIASEEFRQAATAQARSLGAPERGLFVAHPIQDRTDEEMRALANDVADAILQALLEAES